MSDIFNMADTWNNGATTFTSILMNVTDTASAATSKLMDLQVGSSSRFAVGKAAGSAYDSASHPYIRLTSSLGAGSGWELSTNPNGTTTLPVPTFRPVSANSTIALDLCPRGVATDIGYGLAWFDICNTDQIAAGNAATKTLHMGIGNDGTADYCFIGATRYVAAAHLPLKFGRFDGDAGTWLFSMVQDVFSNIQFMQNTAFGAATPLGSSQAIFAAGSTGRSPLRLTAGVAPTSPVNGDIWFDGTNIKMQVGGVTKTFTLT